MRDIDELLSELQRSDFRRRQKLTAKDLAYLHDKGIDVIREHTREFITKRLAPAEPPNDGKQTPWRGHPTFTAQHATATCCRGCLAKWHKIQKGRELSRPEIEYIVDVIDAWLSRF
ncbi:MAG TPA: DUF4186 domain-containing protein [Pyrinomonadaceae bacterium]|nr:DUF4186 domain-containing protein [Pyrinomonadaceae bacterium]